MDFVDLTARELAHFAHSAGMEPSALDAVEQALNRKLPSDVRRLTAVFRGGGDIGDKLHHFSWSIDDPENVVERTRHFRAQGLPETAVAIAVAGRILHVISFHTAYPMVHSYVLTSSESPTVLEQPLREQDSIYFFSYAGFLLDRLETLRYVPARAAMLKRFPKLTPRAAREWRHRWAPHEAQRIDEILRRGIRPTDNLPTHVVDGTEYVDLRGYVVPMTYRPGPLPTDPPPPPPWIERVDLSFADGSFFDLRARDCLFRAARMSCAKGRFERCDFTMLDAEHSMWQGMGEEFVDCDFTGAYFAGCHMGRRYERCDFTAADLWRAPIDLVTGRASVADCTLTAARVSGDFGPWRWLKYGFPLDTSDVPS